MKLIKHALKLLNKLGVPIDADNPLFVHSAGEVSTSNSTATPLGGGGVFTGTSEEVVNESIIIVSVYANVASATDGLSIQFSTDNTNWDHTDVFTIAAATGKTFSFQPVARYFRVVYTNGAGAQSAFRLQSVLKASYVKPSSHRIADAISGQDDAELVKSILTGKTPGGTFVNFQATTAGNFKMSLEELESGISSNSNSQLNVTNFDSSGVENSLYVNDPYLTISHGSNPLISKISWFNKFGAASALTDGNRWEVWDGNRAYVWPTSASITHIRAAVDSAVTRSVTLEIQGVDTNYDLVIQEKATDASDSTTEIELDTALRRVFRVKVLDDTEMDQDIWVGPDPASAANSSAIITTGNNQTLMAILTVPNGKTGYLPNYYCDYVRSAAKDPNGIEFKLWARDNTNGYAPQLKHAKGIPKQAAGFDHPFKPYYKFLAKTDVFLTGQPSGAGAHANAGFDMIMIDD